MIRTTVPVRVWGRKICWRVIHFITLFSRHIRVETEQQLLRRSMCECFSLWKMTVFNSKGCYKEFLQSGWLKTTGIHSLTVLEARGLTSRYQQDMLPPWSVGKSASLPLPAWPAILGLPRVVTASSTLCLHPHTSAIFIL